MVQFWSLLCFAITQVPSQNQLWQAPLPSNCLRWSVSRLWLSVWHTANIGEVGGKRLHHRKYPETWLDLFWSCSCVKSVKEERFTTFSLLLLYVHNICVFPTAWLISQKACPWAGTNHCTQLYCQWPQLSHQFSPPAPRCACFSHLTTGWGK